MSRPYVTRSVLPPIPTSGVTAPMSQTSRETASPIIGITGKEGSAYINLLAQGPDEYFIFSNGFTVDGDGNAHFAGGGTFDGELVAAYGTLGKIVGGILQNQDPSPTNWIRISGNVARPATGFNYIDLAATGSQQVAVLGGLTVLADGTTELQGSLAAATGTFAGDLSAATGTFSGTVTSGATIAAQTFAAPEAHFQSLRLGNGNSLIFSNPTGGGLAGPIYVNADPFDGLIIHNSVQVDAISRIGGPITVSGSKGGNAALASLLAALQTIGLITDSTT